ncbi:MAG: SDR family oxidoreductase [Candidatus Bathyarchaeota archaeon]|nr:SDR family oxidoreductase [Candidatus Bathyarchaeota archaeon]
MKNKICIVTGSNSGIGKETALALADMDATVVMVVRNKQKGELAQREIEAATGNDKIDLMLCDVSSMKNVREFTANYREKYDKLHVLVNNAGAVFSKRQESEEGYEMSIATNYLGMFMLTHKLIPLLKASAPSRIINLSSGMSKTGNIDFEDLQTTRNYSSMKVYANTKLMVTTYTYALAEKLKGTGVTANVAEPGFVATNLGANTGSLRDKIAFMIVRPMQVSAKKGAETSVWVATAPELEEVSGKTFAKKKEVKSADVSYDQEVQRCLCEETMTLLGLDS